MNFATTVVTIEVQTSDGNFVTFDEEAAVQSAKTTTASSSAQITYPITIFNCDANANPIADVPAVLPGSVIRFCIALAQANANAHVERIEEVTYRSTEASLEPKNIVGNGEPLNTLTLVDCSHRYGGKFRTCTGVGCF